MKLYINTASQKTIILELKDNAKVIGRLHFDAEYKQAEKLLPAIEILLKQKQRTLKDIKSIIVENRGEGFTSLRIGVATANALIFALGLPGILVSPAYSREPSVTLK